MKSSWFKKWFSSWRRRPTAADFPAVSVDDSLLPMLEELADQQQTTVEHMAAELLYEATLERRIALDNLAQWKALTPRERETAALICLGHTNQEIADEMIISPNTVKTHVRNILAKFEVNSKIDLQQALGGWDFEGWLAQVRDDR